MLFWRKHYFSSRGHISNTNAFHNIFFQIHFTTTYTNCNTFGYGLLQDIQEDCAFIFYLDIILNFNSETLKDLKKFKKCDFLKILAL